jgi:hypothetical protein
MQLTTRGKIVVTVFWTATIAALLIWWGHIVAQHDRAIFQQCQQNQYDCNHLNPEWYKHGKENP